MVRVGSGNGRYRTKIEVLRDIVRAASTEQRKTRIIGMANLNQGSFQRYASLGVSLGLLKPTQIGLMATPAGEEWLGAVETILSKTSEVAAAIESLGRITHGGHPGAAARERPKPAYDAVQLLGRLAWADLRPAPVPSAEMRSDADRRPVAHLRSPRPPRRLGAHR